MKTCRLLMLAALGAVCFVASAGAASDQNRSGELSAQRRAQITVFPRYRLGPDAKRHCQAWLEKEYRVSGPVIVPRQRCWWQ